MSRVEPENGIVTLMRGDTFTMPLRINAGSKLSPKYRSLVKGEKLYFGLMEPGQAFEDAVIKKVYDELSQKDEDGNTLLVLRTEDTENLYTGKYYYMVKLRSKDKYGNEIVETIIPNTIFWIEGNNPERQQEVRTDAVVGSGIRYKHITLDGLLMI